ncbi:hypothetical protein HKK72_35715 [Actinomadura sp. HBU206391]|nr:hypothetical protein [Actinomadura sp. HBU206391]
MHRIDLAGLDTGPAQTWGSVRLVPLVRETPIADLRLHEQLYDEDVTVVGLDGRTSYVSYVPHAFVATWTDDGTPAAAYGTHLRHKESEGSPRHMPVRYRRRMARRVAKDRLRFLPLDLAMEGYLALHFGGPEIAWEEWSQRALRYGMSPRVEEAYTGADVRGLDDALRIFEIHPRQCGVLVYVADALAAAFIVPHPADYRALHATLVCDLFGDLVYQYGLMTLPVRDFTAHVGDATVGSLADLRAAADRQTAEWARFHETVMAGTLLGGDHYAFDPVYRLGRFTLWRFLPSFSLRDDSHIGEAISDDQGRLAYLKTYRLSPAQTRRGYLLTRLAAHDWNLEATAAGLGTDTAGLAVRLEGAGFGHLLREDILGHYRAKGRRRT